MEGVELGPNYKNLKFNMGRLLSVLSGFGVCGASAGLTYDMDISNQTAIASIRVWTLSLVLVLYAIHVYFECTLTEVSIYWRDACISLHTCSFDTSHGKVVVLLSCKVIILVQCAVHGVACNAVACLAREIWPDFLAL